MLRIVAAFARSADDRAGVARAAMHTGCNGPPLSSADRLLITPRLLPRGLLAQADQTEEGSLRSRSR